MRNCSGSYSRAVMLSDVTALQAAQELYQRRCIRADLAKFTREIVWGVKDYGPQPHHLDWFNLLQDETIRCLNIVAPPKYGKTPTLQDFVAWLIGKNPSIHILYISNTASQANKPSLAIRNTIEFNTKYKSIFCLLYTSPSPRDRQRSRMPSSA